MLIKHKENCLSINGKQSVKLEKGIIKFEFCFKQIPVPFKIHADFECYLKSVKCNEGSYTEKFRTIFLVVLLIKLFVLMIVLLLKEYINKNLIMSKEEEHLFKKSNSCWICKKIINNDEEKVRDHFQLSKKSSCNIS